MNLDAPPDPLEPSFEVRRAVRDFDDPAGGPVHEPALYGRGSLALDELVGGAVPVVEKVLGSGQHMPVKPDGRDRAGAVSQPPWKAKAAQ
ncbi:hypothetical protein [Streptosporangium sp. NPDC048865]|uniref:hypothetical protein n=1 Tax=Streptosporangium sp. NPDC048865 TaxID=3155766 RepID=UPI0034432DC1